MESLSRFVIRLADEVGRYKAIDILRLGTIMADTLVALLTDELENDASLRPESSKHVLLLRIKAFMRQNLGDPDLSPTEIAAAHHVSVRSLHRLFESEDITVTEWIRSQRLDRCRRDLADPRFHEESICGIAKRWGFKDAAYFSRTFRAAYGVSPREWRRSGVHSQQAGVHFQ